MSDSEHFLQLKNLKKHFYENNTLFARLYPGVEKRTIQAVDGVNLTIEEGATLGLVGESGCGKSTLAETVLQLIEPTEGQVFFEGMDLANSEKNELREFRKKAQIIFQDPFSSLNPRYTVMKTLIEPMEVHDIGDSDENRRDRARRLIKRVGLSEEHLGRYPHEFSGGQRQRIAIARALAVEPKLIVADEPVSALDVSVQSRILNLLKDLQGSMDLTMILISHDLSVVRQMCDEVAVMYLGEIVERAETQELFEDPKHPYTEVLVSSIPIPDPSVQREKTTLEGDVPSPINPPANCRFHPRCPQVIPPPDWEGNQYGWRRIIHFKKQVVDEDLNVDEIRNQLKTEYDNISKELVIEHIFEKYIESDGILEDKEAIIPEDSKRVLERVLSLLIDDRQSEARSVIEDSFESICESQEPPRVNVDEHEVLCHLYTE